MESNLNIIKSLLIVGLVGTAKIVSNIISSKDPETEQKQAEISETNLSKIISDIRGEMNTHLSELPEDQKLLRNYVRGRLATLEDIENRLK